MRKFEFRLRKVLEYRETMEQWAQDAYLETRVARLEGEAALLEVQNRRAKALEWPVHTLDERRQLEMNIQALDDDEIAKRAVIEVLATEEEKALAVWHEKKRELETITKLRDHALEAWLLEDTRHEQAALDEWSVLRRSA